jgi:hypothetical protein
MAQLPEAVTSNEAILLQVGASSFGLRIFEKRWDVNSVHIAHKSRFSNRLLHALRARYSISREWSLLSCGHSKSGLCAPYPPSSYGLFVRITKARGPFRIENLRAALTMICTCFNAKYIEYVSRVAPELRFLVPHRIVVCRYGIPIPICKVFRTLLEKM